MTPRPICSGKGAVVGVDIAYEVLSDKILPVAFYGGVRVVTTKKRRSCVRHDQYHFLNTAGSDASVHQVGQGAVVDFLGAPGFCPHRDGVCDPMKYIQNGIAELRCVLIGRRQVDGYLAVGGEPKYIISK